MARTYNDIIEDYLAWYSKATGNPDFLPSNYLEGDEEDVKLKKAAAWKAILELCYKETEGFYWFCKFILGDMTYAGYPTPIHFNGLWWKWTKLVKESDHIAIKCPRQHGKSTYWTVLQALYRTAMFESYNVLISSASEDQAVALMSFIVRLILNNEFLESKKSPSAKWSTTELSYNGGKILARGVGSEVRGGTYDYIICDDILRSDNKLSDQDIENYIDEELEPMLFVRKGQLVIVGTPKSDTDIFSVIEERVAHGAAWKYVVYQAVLDEEKKEVLCPDRFTYEQLMQIKALQGQQKFDKEFMCRTYSSGSQLFPMEIRKQAMELGRSWTMYNKAKVEDNRDWTYYIGMDCARSGSASGDYTVAIVIAYNSTTQEKRIVWLWRKKGLKITEQVENIALLSRAFGDPPILVEKNNIGQEFIDIMVDNYNLHVEDFVTTKMNKENLIRFLISCFESEKIILPMGDEFSREQTKLIDTELDRFVIETTKAGNEIMKGSGRAHDDIVIALALANKCSQSYGYTPFAETSGDRKETSLGQFAANGDIREVLRF